MTIETLAFLVGCPRSGTTLLQSLLASHSQIASFPETQFFHHMLRRGYKQGEAGFGLVSRNLRPRLEKFFREDLDRPELIRRLPKIPLRGYYTRKFIKILKELAEEQGGTILLEKTPDHVYCIKYIEQYLPRSKFIHLIRNGTDVVASLYEVTHNYPEPWGGAKSIDTCIMDWLLAIRASQQYRDRPNHLIVRYEALVEKPERVLGQICQFLNIEFEGKMIDDYAKKADYISFEEGGRTVDTRQINSHKSEKFFTIFTPQQQAYIIDKLSVVNLEEISQ